MSGFANFTLLRDRTIAGIGLATGAMHLYGPTFGTWQQLPVVSLSLFLVIAILIKPLAAESNVYLRRLGGLIDGILIAGIVFQGVWLALNYNAFLDRFGKPSQLDVMTGIILVTAILEVTRRHYGWIIVLLVVGFVSYAHWGQLMPGMFAHAGASWLYISEYIYRDSGGIYGTAVSVVANYVVLFFVMGSIMERSGVGDILLDLSKALAGRSVAAAGKIAVVSSAFFGTISGSAVANVVSQGVVTIPMMKKTGFKGSVAAAIEAASSSGGTIMPPIMGATAFIAAQNAGVPYVDFAFAALIPSLLYFGCIFVFVHLEGQKSGIRALEKAEIPPLAPIIARGWWIPLPFVVLTYMLIAGYSPARGAVFTLLCLVVVIFLVHGPRRGTDTLLYGLQQGAIGCAALMAVCAASGILTSMMDAAGLAVKMTYLIVSIADGDRMLMLILVAAVTLILGLGLPITAAYLTVAVLSVPVLESLGVTGVGAHLFILYFAAISAITPPVALASFAAATIARTSAWITSFQSVRVGFVGFLAPFLFVERPALLLLDTPFGEIVYACLTAALGLFALSIGFVGYINGPVGWPFRAVMFVTGLLLVFFNALWIDVASATVLFIVLAYAYRDKLFPRGTVGTKEPVVAPSAVKEGYDG